MWLMPCSTAARGRGRRRAWSRGRAPRRRRSRGWTRGRWLRRGRARSWPEGYAERRVQAARAKRLAVERGVAVARVADRRGQLVLALERSVEVVGGYLDAPEDPVVAHA